MSIIQSELKIERNSKYCNSVSDAKTIINIILFENKQDDDYNELYNASTIEVKWDIQTMYKTYLFGYDNADDKSPSLDECWQ